MNSAPSKCQECLVPPTLKQAPTLRHAVIATRAPEGTRGDGTLKGSDLSVFLQHRTEPGAEIRVMPHHVPPYATYG